MISTTTISLGFGSQQVLRDVNVTLTGNTRAGLIGANGSGKTTLLRILAGATSPDSGTVTIARSVRIAWLPQQIALPPDSTVYNVAEEGYQREYELEESRHKLSLQLEEDPHDDAALVEVARIDEELESADYHTRQTHIHRVLRGLGFKSEESNTPVGNLSGGWAMRVVLARTLLARPDFLLLDEPTNYLDTESRLWLAKFLTGFPGGYLLVSHDRAFLDDTVGEIFELFNGRIRRFRGTFTRYEEQRREELDLLIKKWEEQQQEVARQEQFIRRFRAQANKARQVQSRIRMLEKMELIEIPEHLRPISISLPRPPRSSQLVLETNRLSRRYGSVTALNNLSFSVERGHRTAVIGRNGAGKTTLLRILANRDDGYSGEIVRGTGVETGYFAQDSPEKLPSGTTVYEYLEDHATDDSRPRLRSILGAFLFSGDTVEKPLEVLSGGERSRLAMASLLVQPLNLLILDEPTNHLDMTSQDVLARALQRYEGTVVFVSHDRHFLRLVATDVLALRPEESERSEQWHYYPGSYGEFENSALGTFFEQPEEILQRRSASSAPAAASARDGSDEYTRNKAKRSEVRRLQSLESEQLKAIESLEEEHRFVQREMARPEIYSDGESIRVRQSRICEIETKLETLHRGWEETTERLEALKN